MELRNFKRAETILDLLKKKQAEREDLKEQREALEYNGLAGEYAMVINTGNSNIRMHNERGYKLIRIPMSGRAMVKAIDSRLYIVDNLIRKYEREFKEL